MAMKTMITSHEEGIKKLRGLTKNIKFCMLTTVDETGVLRSRPTTIQKMDINGDLYIVIGRNTGAATAVEHNHCVNASFANECGDVAVSVYGRAKLIGDRQKMAELWEPIFQLRFPQGLDDPNLALMKIEVESAEHWDSRRRVLSTLVKTERYSPRGAFPVPADMGNQTNETYDRCE